MMERTMVQNDECSDDGERSDDGECSDDGVAIWNGDSNGPNKLRFDVCDHTASTHQLAS